MKFGSVHAVSGFDASVLRVRLKECLCLGEGRRW